MTEDEEWEAVRAALTDAGVDPADLSRFVNRPNPDLPGLEPERFEARRAYPVLMAWLPRVQSRGVVDTLARRIAETGKRSESARALIIKYRERADWAVGDSIARTMTAVEHDDVVELCADRSGGYERQMLVYALWRIKTERARALIRELVRDPTVATHAMYSARRAFGNEEARRLIEPLIDDGAVGDVARKTLKRIDRARR